MGPLLLINPNTSVRTLDMMLAIARGCLPPDVTIRGVCAAAGAPMIVDDSDLLTAAEEVVRLGVSGAAGVSAIIVAAFGDPGVDALRRAVPIPVAGIGESAMLEAALGGRRFGVATTTPDLARSIEAAVARLSLSETFTGVRVPDGDPRRLADDEERQEQALARAVAACVEQDGAKAVIIGGGPLSDAARALRGRFVAEIVEPVPAAVRWVTRTLG